MNRPIPYGHHDINEDDIQAVVQVLRSDFLTQGPVIPRFEAAVAKYCGAKHAVAVSNATTALHLACLAANLGPGDALWTSPNTFVASANCGRYCGADVDFVDIDPRTYNMSADALRTKLETAAKPPKVLIPVHFAGQSCDMAAISELRSKHGFAVIEDASHAIGGNYRGRPVGSCEHSDMTVFSFHPVKIITTGEGGLILTNRTDLYERLLLLRAHGITRDESKMPAPSDGPWYYAQIELGFNYRLTDIQAALGLSQLERLDEFVERRNQLAKRYDQALKDLPLTLPYRTPDALSAFHLYVIRLKPGGQIAKSHRKVFESLRNAGIGVNLHYIPVHLQPYYQALGFRLGDFPEAERYYQEAITIPLYSSLTEANQDRVIEALKLALLS